MKYTKKQREEAILICAIAASTPEAWNYMTIEKHVDTHWQSRILASDAWDAAQSMRHHFFESTVSHPDAEAECLLRDGWSPGDPVEARR